MNKPQIVYKYSEKRHFFIKRITLDEEYWEKYNVIPPFTTDIPVPPYVDGNNVRIYDTERKCWLIKEGKPIKYTAETFDSGQDLSKIKFPLSFNNDLFRAIQYGYSEQWAIPEIITNIDINLAIATRYRHLQEIINNSLFLYSKFWSNNHYEGLESDYYYNIEAIIHMMKRIIDDTIMLSFITIYQEEVLQNIINNNEEMIRIDSIGSLFKNKESKKQKMQELLDNIKISKFESLFRAINGLHNAFKHDLLTNRAFMLYSKEFPYVFAEELIKKDKIIVELRHDLRHLIIGFNDYLEDYFKIKKFEGEHFLYRRNLNDDKIPKADVAQWYIKIK